MSCFFLCCTFILFYYEKVLVIWIIKVNYINAHEMDINVYGDMLKWNMILKTEEQ